MSYEPLHHKYRPKSFAELVGQEAIATTLTNAINTAKIAPAYLFTGPRGTGKTSSARILAKSLNCLNSDQPTAQPCGVCDVCQGITKGYSLDVIEIDAASNTGVDNIRELIEKAQFAPVQCRYKVYVVDECHMLSTAAFNALLKTLEEPPKHVVFVLATTDPQRVLPTIISRCQRFDFRRIQLEAMVKHLSAIASKESINISADALTLIGQIAQGGLRDAESLLDQLALTVGEVTPDKVWDLVGSVSEQDLIALLNAIAQNNPEGVLDCSRKILDSGREPLIILQNLAALYRDLLIAQTAANRQDLVTCTQQTWIALVELSQKLDMSTILRGQQHLRTSEVQIKNTTQPRLWLEVTLLGLLPSANIQPQAVNTPQRLNAPAVATNYYPVVSTPPQLPTEKATPRTCVEQTVASTPIDHHNSSPNSLSSPPPENVSIPQASSQDKPFTHSAPPVSPISASEEVVEVTQSDFVQVWQQVLEYLEHPLSKALFKQHGRLLNFNHGIAEVGMPPGLVKPSMKKQITDIEVAFMKVCQHKVTVSLVSNKSKIAAVNGNSPVPSKDSTPIQQPPAANYNQQIQSFTPTAPATPTPVITPVKTESMTGAARVQTLPPQQMPRPLADWETDEVENAAKRLAKFFDGQIIRLTDDGVDSPESMTISEGLDEPEIDDE
ncbi:MAG TPA: DNA polymerase III subunit gamma/tau [Nodularia sp. (in: cyanobacteria)]|nr:DNA polymerase III subunit gamma/tau [Nodularia sp. (in: cyanobacteria)]